MNHLGMRFCLDCDYPLIGLHRQRCPECGRPFDLDDPVTYATNTNERTYQRIRLAVSCSLFLFGTANVMACGLLDGDLATGIVGLACVFFGTLLTPIPEPANHF